MAREQLAGAPPMTGDEDVTTAGDSAQLALGDAIKLIAALREQVDGPVKALKPFGDAAGWIPQGWSDDKSIELPPDCLTAAHFRRARAAIAAAERPVARCPVCDWPMAATRDQGCVLGNCSYRPDEGSEEHRRIQQRRKELAAAEKGMGKQ